MEEEELSCSEHEYVLYLAQGLWLGMGLVAVTISAIFL